MTTTDKVKDILSRIEAGEPKDPLIHELQDVLKNATEKPFVFDIGMLPENVTISDILGE